MQKKTFWLIALLMLALAAFIVYMAPLSQNEISRKVAEVAPATDAWRAALPRDPAAATAAYMARLPAAATARSDAYFEGGYWLQLIGFVAGIAVSWVLLSSRILVALRDKLERYSQRRWLNNAILIAAFTLLSSILSAPLDVYQRYFREHLYGLANQSFGPWFSDFLLNFALAMVVGTLFISLIFVVMRRLVQTWWIWGAVLSVAFMAFMMLIGPTYIDPLFNTYTALSDEKVKQPILSMARANGVPADNVYQFDASKQSNRISANVSGIFGSAAVRLNDNLLKRTSQPEIEAVMGHELGHYVLNHVYHFLLTFGVLLVVGFAFVKTSYAWALRRWGQRWGIRDQADPVGLPLLAALFSVYLFVMTPVFNTTIRSSEVEADAFGINTSQQADGMAEAHLKLTEYRKANPSDIEEFFFYDHPAPKKRIYMAMRWKAEHWQRP
ncbi:M48 family metallopeptidase [Undibacterium sp.]|uniref:M48 family metallopeptidase n=1 Tax=Undibacterium sp. TaxID=1914977 RepID=UPI0025E74D7C|nr:M48 family metallopeptidase [Undibacterium sp.]